jgi:hypothetical protein
LILSSGSIPQVVVLEVVPERRRSRAAVSPYRLHRVQSTKVMMVRESPKLLLWSAPRKVRNALAAGSSRNASRAE